MGDARQGKLRQVPGPEKDGTRYYHAHVNDERTGRLQGATTDENHGNEPVPIEFFRRSTVAVEQVQLKLFWVNIRCTQ